MIKRYGLLIGLLIFFFLVSARDTATKTEPTAWQQLGRALVWPFKPFEVVDCEKARRKYKAEILAGWENLSGQDSDLENWDSLDDDAKLKAYIRHKLNNLKQGESDESILPTRNQILIWKYGYKCRLLRWIPRFLHGSPYTYGATALYYCTLAIGSKAAYKKAKEWVHQKRKKETKKQVKKMVHEDCEWCMARQREIG